MARSRPTRPQRPGSGRGAGEGDSDLTDLTEEVRALVERELLHVPPPLEDAPVDLPFDLTTVDDKELQRLYSAFSSYSYRTGYLLTLEETKEQKCKEAADEIAQAYLAQHGEGEGTITSIKAQAEQLDDVKKWRTAQRRYGILASALRKDRDNYDKVCERLSRLETMRHQEWERSGNRIASRKK